VIAPSILPCRSRSDACLQTDSTSCRSAVSHRIRASADTRASLAGMDEQAELEQWVAALEAFDTGDHHTALDVFSKIAGSSKVRTLCRSCQPGSEQPGAEPAPD
jgi:hypothetical protein